MFNDENENNFNTQQSSEPEEKITENDAFEEKNVSFTDNKPQSSDLDENNFEIDSECEFMEVNSDDNIQSSSENDYTYSYSQSYEYNDYDKDENKKTKKEKRFKFFSTLGVCASLAICLVAGTLIGLSIAGKKEVKDTHFHQSNAAGQAAEKETVEQFVPNGEELSTEDIAAKVGPAVVGIVNKTNLISFFNQSPESSGSGVIINEDGYIVTNYHVVENARELKVILNTGKECEATIVGFDSRSDLAVLKIEEGNLTYANFGDSSQVNVGGRVIAIGNPLGTELMGTVTQGIISAVNRTVTVEDKTLTLLQTDAAINNGNSGGPLVNAYGEVIGINSVKMAATGVEGIGFAIPSNEVKSVVDDLINNGYVTGRLIVGVSGTNITEKLSAYYDLPVGFYVNEVYEGYGAYLAGVQPGDVIIKCDGKNVATVDDINAIRDTHEVGDMMSVVVWRNGKEVNIKIRLMEENPEITQ